MGAAVGGCAVEVGELGGRGGEADLEAFDLTEPAIGLRFGDAVAEVADDLDEAGLLVRVELEDGAADAPLTELTPMFQQFMASFDDWR
ncbi:hypothetical protein GCM10010191_81960 [Actinomadura vinacea]|uniref:Uncharacterized protein n=1 Tax=Actinomadura vinacea TaxID=115336 RepID=A0ABN3KAD3_9ACTN